MQVKGSQSEKKNWGEWREEEEEEKNANKRAKHEYIGKNTLKANSMWS